MQKRQKQSRRGSGNNHGYVAKIALFALVTVGVITILAVAPGIGAILKLIDPNPRRAMYKLDRALRGLERQGKVSSITKNGQRGYVITGKGRLQLARQRFDGYQFKPSKSTHWDGKWRFICFDIPEKRKYVRHILHDKLVELGFYRLQDSVFVFPYPCAEFITLSHEAWQLQKHMRLMTATYIDEENSLLSHFKLSR